MNLEVFFQGWAPIARVLIIAAVIYVSVAAVLPLAAVRALAKMSAYDLILTIALGSLVATIRSTSRFQYRKAWPRSSRSSDFSSSRAGFSSAGRAPAE